MPIDKKGLWYPSEGWASDRKQEEEARAQEDQAGGAWNVEQPPMTPRGMSMFQNTLDLMRADTPQLHAVDTNQETADQQQMNQSSRMSDMLNAFDQQASDASQMADYSRVSDTMPPLSTGQQRVTDALTQPSGFNTARPAPVSPPAQPAQQPEDTGGFWQGLKDNLGRAAKTIGWAGKTIHDEAVDIGGEASDKLMRTAISATDSIAMNQGKNIIADDRTPDFIQDIFKKGMAPAETTGDRAADFTGNVLGLFAPTMGAYKLLGKPATIGTEALLKSAPNWVRIGAGGVAGAAATGALLSTGQESAEEVVQPNNQTFGEHALDVAKSAGYFGAYGVAGPIAGSVMHKVGNALPKVVQSGLARAAQTAPLAAEVGRGAAEGALSGAMVGAGMGAYQVATTGDLNKGWAALAGEAGDETAENFVEAIAFGVAHRMLGRGMAVLPSHVQPISDMIDTKMQTFQNDVIAQFNDETRAEFNELKDQAKAAGVPEEEATMAALDQLVQHPEGFTLVNTALEQVIQSEEMAQVHAAPVQASNDTMQPAAVKEPVNVTGELSQASTSDAVQNTAVTKVHEGDVTDATIKQLSGESGAAPAAGPSFTKDQFDWLITTNTDLDQMPEGWTLGWTPQELRWGLGEQPANQPEVQPADQPAVQQAQPTPAAEQPANQLAEQPANQPTDQPTDQPAPTPGVYTVGDRIVLKGKPNLEWTITGPGHSADTFRIQTDKGGTTTIHRQAIQSHVSEIQPLTPEAQAQADIEATYKKMRDNYVFEAGKWKPDTKVKRLQEIKDYANQHGLEFHEHYQRYLDQFTQDSQEYKNRQRKAKDESWQDAGKRLTAQELHWELEKQTTTELRQLQDSLGMPKGGSHKNVIVSRIADHLTQPASEAPATPVESAPAAKPSEKVHVTDKGVPYVPQRVTIQDGKVKVQSTAKKLHHEQLPRNFDVKSLSGMSYTFNLDDYLNAGKSFGNPHYAISQFIKKQFNYQGMMEKHDHSPVIDRIVDSQIYAIEKAIAKLGIETAKVADRKPKEKAPAPTEQAAPQQPAQEEAPAPPAVEAPVSEEAPTPKQGDWIQFQGRDFQVTDTSHPDRFRIEHSAHGQYEISKSLMNPDGEGSIIRLFDGPPDSSDMSVYWNGKENDKIVLEEVLDTQHYPEGTDIYSLEPDQIKYRLVEEGKYDTGEYISRDQVFPREEAIQIAQTLLRNKYGKDAQQEQPAAQPAALAPVEPSSKNGITIQRNKEKDGVEISFAQKPGGDVIKQLQDAKFRWSPKQKIWYHKYTPERWAFLQRLQNPSSTLNDSTDSNKMEEPTQATETPKAPSTKETVIDTYDKAIAYTKKLVLGDKMIKSLIKNNPTLGEKHLFNAFQRDAMEHAMDVGEIISAHKDEGMKFMKEVADGTLIRDLFDQMTGKAAAKSAEVAQTYRVQRIDTVDADVSPKTAAEKPHGLYVSIIENSDTFESPHADMGDTVYTGEVTPKNPLIADEMKVPHERFKGLASRGPASSGVAALKQLMPDQFDEFLQMKKSELVQRLEKQFPGADYTKYHDAWELLEAYAGQEARAQGYDAIILLDKGDPNFSEMVVLDRNIIQIKPKVAEQPAQIKEEANNESVNPVGPASEGPLEGTPSNDVPGTGENGQTGTSPVRGPRTNQGRDDGAATGGSGVSDSVGSSQGNVAVPPGRGDSADAGQQSGDVGSSGRGSGRQLNTQGTNYAITPDDDLGLRGKKTSYKDNVRAIKLMKQINEENRQATAEEQKTLVKYVGWGGIAEPFSPKFAVPAEWKAEQAELTELLTPDEYKSASSTILNAHYTSKDVIQGMYEGLQHFGFEGGRVLEPSMGIGHFVGLMPLELAKASKVTGVEIDPITGNIAKLLYPKSDVRIMGFEEAKMADNFYDVAIGNVPFGNYGITDKAYVKTGMNKFIHNYFFAKALDKVRPGGLVMFITSKGTMDASTGRIVREYISSKADLIGAVRLPDTAFKQNAGTEVVTDVLILKKRPEGTAAADKTWIDTQPLVVGNRTFEVNGYYHSHPENVLGEHSDTGSMYRGDSYTVKPKANVDLKQTLANALRSMPENVITAREKKATEEASARDLIPAPGHVRENAFVVQNGQLYVKRNDQLEPATATGKSAERIRGMIGVRDAVRTVIRYQLEDNTTDTILSGSRKTLNQIYDAFVKKHGPLNDPANARVFVDDPDAYLLLSLERYDKDTKKATKADIFTKRTVERFKQATSAANAKEALVITLNEKGRVDLPRMASLVNLPESAVIEELQGLVYNDPQRGWVTQDEYLSGNVKEKLAAAESATALDPAFQENVEALKAVIPEDLVKEDLDIKLGAHWLDPQLVGQFAAHLHGVNDSRFEVGYNNQIAEWDVRLKSKGDTWIRNKAESNIEWGTNDYDALDLVNMTLNLKTPVVKRTIHNADGTKSTYTDQKATVAVREKQILIKEEFTRWLWSDTARETELLQIYNDRFNTERLREFEGNHLTFPGMNPIWANQLKTHQKAAVWRAMQSGNTLFAHAVGAGKTAEMIATMVEMKRTGVVNKPMWAVPNHLVEQSAAAFMEIYPTANLLVAGKKDFEAKNRKRLFAKIATGTYDAIIVPHSSFGKVSMSHDAVKAFYDEQLDQLELSIQMAVAESGKSSGIAKKLESAKKRLVTKMNNQLDRIEKDDNVSFEELGVDSLVIDEAHEFKNLFYSTKMNRVAGLGSQDGSGKAFDLYMKVRYLQQLNGGRGVLFATGTPVSNTLAEMYTMQRYLQHDELNKRGILNFDAWVSQFGDVKNVMEVAPEGKGLRLRTKLAEVVNLPELLHMFRSFADVKTADELLKKGLIKRPELKESQGRARTPVVVAPSDELLVFVDELAVRAEAIRSGKVKPDEDNMLRVVGEGRKAALDMRLIDPSLPDLPDSKVNIAVGKIAEIYKETKKYKTTSGKTMENGTQLVFLDLSTPTEEKTDKDGNALQSDGSDQENVSVYNDLRAKLLKQGIKREEIAFIHDYNTDAKKEELFRKVNNGEIRILLGSTAKMGAGMNVQKRLVALHHMDVPWRPSDIEQREGRILRQGNDNEEVQIYAYITERSFDAYMWQLIAGKAKVVDQTMSGDLKTRRVSDPSGMEMSANEIKALATGDQRIIDLADLDREVAELDMKRQAEVDVLRKIKRQLQDAPAGMEGLQNRIALTNQDLAQKQVTTGDKFTIQFGKQAMTDRAQAGEYLNKLDSELELKVDQVKSLGTFAGFPLEVTRLAGGIMGSVGNTFYLNGKARNYPFTISESALGTIRSMEATLTTMEPRLHDLENQLEQLQTNVTKLQQQQAKVTETVNKHQTDYNEKLAKKLQLEQELSIDRSADQDGTMGAGEEGGGSKSDEYAMPTAKKQRAPRNTAKTRIKALAAMIEDTTKVLTPKASSSIADAIAHALDTNIDRDYVRPGAEGTYNTRQRTGQVRSRSRDEWRIVGHELGHAFSDHMEQIGDSEELRALAAALYPGGTKNMDVETQKEEGFAEFFRLWVTDPIHAKTVAPLTTDLFERIVSGDAKLSKLFGKVRTLVDNDLADNALGRATGSIVNTLSNTSSTAAGDVWELNWWQKLSFNLADSLIPAKMFSKAAGEGSESRLVKLLSIVGDNQGKAIGTFRSRPKDQHGRFVAEQSLQSIMQKGVTAIGEALEWKTMEFADNKTSDAMDIFSAIAIAKRILERTDRGFDKLPMTPETAEEVLQIAEQRFPDAIPHIEQYAETFSNVVLDILVNGDALTPAARKTIKEKSHHYVPFIYDDSKDAASKSGKTSGGRTYKKPVKYFTGKVMPVLNVYQASLIKLAEVHQAIEYKRVIDQIHDMAQDEGVGKFARIVPAPISAVKIDTAELITRASELMGLDQEITDQAIEQLQQRTQTFFRPGNLKDIDPKDPIIMNVRNGKPAYIKLAPDMWRMVEAMAPVQLSGFGKGLAWASRITRFTALNTVRYVTNTVARDLPTVLIQSKNPVGTLVRHSATSLRIMMGTYLNHHMSDAAWAQKSADMYDAFVTSGGASGAAENMFKSMLMKQYSTDMIQTKADGWHRQTLKNGKKAFVRVLNLATTDQLRLLEEGPRLTEWVATVKREAKKLGYDGDEMYDNYIREGTDGLPEDLQDKMEDILLDATYNSGEVTTNFRLHGASKWLRQHMPTVPFLHGTVQGTYRAARTIKNNPGRVAIGVTGLLSISALSMMLMSGDDDDRKYLENMDSQSRDKYWWFPIPYAKGLYFAIAKPFDYAIPLNMAERFADQMWDRVKEPMNRKWNSDYASVFSTFTATNVMSQLATSIWDMAANKNALGGKIVPEGDRNLFPVLQAGPTTSLTARMVAEAYAMVVGVFPNTTQSDTISPRMVDYFLRQNFGKYGTYATNVLDYGIRYAQTGSLDEAGKVNAKKDIAGIEYDVIVGSLVYGRAEGASRITDKFYKDFEYAQKLEGSLHDLAERKKVAAMAPYATEKNIRLLKMLPALKSISDDLSQLRKEVEAANTEALTPEQRQTLMMRKDFTENMVAGLVYGYSPTVPNDINWNQNQMDHIKADILNKAQTAMEREAAKAGGSSDAADYLIKVYSSSGKSSKMEAAK